MAKLKGRCNIIYEYNLLKYVLPIQRRILVSWHHTDYIDCFSSVGTVIAAIIAAVAAFQSKASAELSRKSLEDERSRNLQQILLSELSELSERCNSSIGENSQVIADKFKLIELATALTVAREAIDVSDLNSHEKEQVTEYFKRRLRPGVPSEIAGLHSLMNTPQAFSLDVLRQQYRDAQNFLNIQDAIRVQDPIINTPSTP